ncbi:hypothetical protein HPB52_008723 [Rhipicephalus sanguineus]|uniref:RecQ-mediated genome instability protein 1 n=1 Tax=Rhipicephalus sanguineus TaxID=34632 RepID=A0A9D4Q1F3_RHISA|nr:hypothetical protein HPB52_008723 [Rhipicephalus sanguineus]
MNLDDRDRLTEFSRNFSESSVYASYVTAWNRVVLCYEGSASDQQGRSWSMDRQLTAIRNFFRRLFFRNKEVAAAAGQNAEHAESAADVVANHEESAASEQRTTFGGDVYKQVYYQLLLTNLWELGMTCLPESAVTAHKLMLKGSFFLQVDSVHDVSQPAYSQLLKITNTENPNTVVQADPVEKPSPWQAQPKRMLKLELTDGTRRIQAIEFEPIRSMSVDMRPGIKVLITGPVECRRGVMFLRADNVRVLGGMVESLLEGNCREALLCRVLGRDPAQVLGNAPRQLTANRPERDSEDTNNRQNSSDRTSDHPVRVPAASGSPRIGTDFHNDSRATTIPLANSNSTTVRMTSSVLDVDNVWDRADGTDMDPDDVLMSQIDLGKLEPEAGMHDFTDDDVDEDLLREQLEFQAQAAGDGILQDTARTDEHNAGSTLPTRRCLILGVPEEESAAFASDGPEKVGRPRVDGCYSCSLAIWSIWRLVSLASGLDEHPRQVLFCPAFEALRSGLHTSVAVAHMMTPKRLSRESVWPHDDAVAMCRRR